MGIIPPPATMVRTKAASGNIINALGDSISSFSRYMPEGQGTGKQFAEKQGTHFLTWAEAFSRGALNWDLSRGNPGQYGGVLKVYVINGGSNYVAPTITFTGVTGATGTVQTSGGVITGVTVTAAGTAASTIGYTINDASGSGAILSVVRSGTGTFGVPGCQTRDMVARLPDVTSSGIDICTVLGGINDITSLVTVDTITANLRTCYETLAGAGIRVIAIPVLPRAGANSTVQYPILRVNRWIRAYCQGELWANPLGNKAIVLADPTEWLIDSSDSLGYAIGGNAGASGAVTSDGLHPSVLGAMRIGYVVWQAAQRFLGSTLPTQSRAYSRLDLYDATNNPGGFLTDGNVRPFMDVTGVAPTTAGSATASGTLAKGFNLTRSAGTAAGTITASLESPYSDGKLGQRQVLTFSLGSGGTDELWVFQTAALTTTAWGIPGGDLGSGSIALVGEIEVSNLANLARLYIAAYDSNAWLVQTGNAETGASNRLPLSTDIFLVPTKLYLRSQPLLLSATQATIRLVLGMGFDASGGAGSATATIKINHLGIRRASQF
jgi:lysophospholipase L1-like esterase